MDALVDALAGEVLILYCHATGDCHAVALRASSELSQSANCQSVRSRVRSELHRFIKSFDKSQHGRRTTWISGDNISPARSKPLTRYVELGVSLRFNKSSREREIWRRSHKYLSIHQGQ